MALLGLWATPSRGSAADAAHDASSSLPAAAAQQIDATEAFENAVTWPGASAAPDTAVHDGFNRAWRVTPLEEVSDDGFAWEPTFFGPGLTREPMVTTLWDDGSGPALYVGGQLITAGRHRTFGIARWNGSEWAPLGIGVNGPVRAMTVYDGDLIVAGAFTEAAGQAGAPVTVNRIARWDGSQWSPLGIGFPNPDLAVVLAVTVYEGDLIAGGAWLADGDQPTSWIARWDGSEWLPLGGELNQAVWDMAVYQGDLIVGGSFTRAGGEEANGIARWDGSAWSPLGSGTNAAVIRLTVFDGDLIAGGGFTEAGGSFAGRVARWDGSAWSPLGSGVVGTPSPHVRDLDVYGGELIVAGRFTHAGGQTVNHVARWNGSVWSPLAGPNGSGVGGLVWQALDDGAVSTVSVVDGILIAGGEFYTAGGERANYVAQWDGSGWSSLPESGTGPVSFSRDNNAAVRALAVYDGELIVGGGFDDVGVVPGAARVARWDGSSWSPLGAGIDLPFPGLGNEVNALTRFDSDLIVGGGFSQAGGIPGTSLIARWDGAAWSALGSGLSNGGVEALIELDDDLIAAGSFTAAGAQAVQRIARWDGTQWSPLGSGVNDVVLDLAVYEGDLIAAGNFTVAGGVAAGFIARWDGAAWSPLGSGCNSTVGALAVYEGDLIAAGNFTVAGGVPVNRVARWDGTAWSPLGGGVSSPPGTLSARVSALTVFGGDLFAAGLFTSADGDGTFGTVNNLARWDGERWWPLAGPLDVGTAGEPNFPWMFSLGSFDSDGPGPIPEKLIAGGFPLLTGGVPNWGLGVYAPLPLTITPHPLDFGAVLVGETGGPLGLTLTNNTGEPLTVDQVSDPGLPFAAAGGTCGSAPFTLTAGESCTLDHTFSPTAAGAVSAVVTVTSNAPGNPRSVTLRGIGSDGSLAVDPDPLAFGAVAVGVSAGPLSVTLINAVAVTVHVDAVTVPAAPFAAAGGTCGATPFDLDPGAGCTLAFTFGPTTTGSFNTVVEVSHDGSGSPASLELVGDGAEPQLVVSPDPLDFGSVPIGENGGPVSLTLANPGALPVVVSTVSEPGAPFAAQSTTCDVFPFVLAADTSCTLDYTFSPTEPGPASETLTIVSDSPSSPQTVALQGAGTGAVLTVEPDNLATTLPSGATGIEPLTIANPGNATLDWEVTEEGSRHKAILRPRGTVTIPASAVPSMPIEGTGRAPGAGTEPYPFLAPESGVTITHSESLNVVAGNTIACLGGFSTLDNHFLRVFALDDFGLTEGFHVQEVKLGVEFLDITASVEVNLYTLEGDFVFDNLTPIGSATVMLAPQELTLVTVPVSGFAPAGSTLVVEILPPHLGNLGRFFPGSNALGETAPSYWASPACNIPEPVAYADAGFPGVHLVMTVTGNLPVDCGLPNWIDLAPVSGAVPAGEEQLVEVTFDAGDLDPGAYEAILCLASNDGIRPRTLVPLALTVTEAGLPELAFDPSSLDFGDVDVGTTSPPLVATLHNSGTADATGLLFSPPGSGFAAETGDCGSTLPVGGSCAVSVTFTPAAPGPADATLTVTSDQDAPAALALAGLGVAEGAGFTATALRVDPDILVSDGNGVFEPGEGVEVAPEWRNDDTAPQSLSGTATHLVGPDGGNYILALDHADYGFLDAGQAGSCLETGVCYQIGVNDPAVRPAPHWEATFDETLSDDTVKTWTLHIGDSFTDVPRTSGFYPSVETLLHNGVTGGCTSTEYCPAAHNTRAQMPVFVLRALEGSDYEPPACEEGSEVFGDVPFSHSFCPWIEELASRGVVAGCGGGNYCPNAPVTRGQMAVFLLRTLEGSGYTPPACKGLFVDVPCPSGFADWIEELYDREITGGCGSEPLRYCPASPVNRQQMAVFVSRTFELVLYGP